MSTWYNVYRNQSAGTADVYLYGDIVSTKFFGDEITAKEFMDEVQALDVNHLNIRINSSGGSVMQGIAIYNAIRRHPARVTVHVDGIAASIASVIAMAGDDIVMGEHAWLMIHNPFSAIVGDAEAMFAEGELLNRVKGQLIQAYQRRVAMTDAELAEAMDKETWYSADDAVAIGFADRVGAEMAVAASMDLNRFKNVPERLLDKATAPEPLPVSTESIEMKDDTATAPENREPAAEPVNVVQISEAAAKAAYAENQKRMDAIKARFKGHNQPDLLVECLGDGSCSPEDAANRLLDKLGAETKPASPAFIVHDEVDKFKASAIQGLMSRAGYHKPDGANSMRNAGFRRIAEECLINAGQHPSDVRNMRPINLMAAAITHTTGMFPNILEDTMHKMIVSNYEAFQDTWRRWCKIGEVSDFRAHSRLKLGSFNNLVTVNEAGLYEVGDLPDAEKETQTATTKGREIVISRQMLVNDDLGVFADLGRAMGRAAARTVEVDVYADVASNPTMSDGLAFFHTSHNNLAGAAAPSVTSVAAAEDAMRSQTDVGGNETLDIRPQSFVGSLGYARTMTEVIGSEFTPETTGSRATRRRNALFGLIPEDNVIGTPRISTNDWYLFADPMEAPAWEVAFLDGITEPFIDSVDTLNPDGVRMLVRLDYGVAAIDWRGGYKHPA